MRQYLSTMCSDAPAPGLDGSQQHSALCKCMVKSLYRHNSKATVLVHHYTGYHDTVNKLLDAAPSVKLQKLPRHHTKQLMLYEVYWLLSHTFAEGDEIIVADDDLIFQADPFQMFVDSDWDAAYTTRGYEYPVPVNAGIWALRWGKGAKMFAKFMLSQLMWPSWQPYLDTLDQMDRINPRDTYPPELGERRVSDQVFLWAVHNDGGIPAPCQIADVGPKYNYCPAEDKLGTGGARKALQEARKKPDKYVVLHYKGPMKGVMLEDWEDDTTKGETE